MVISIATDPFPKLMIRICKYLKIFDKISLIYVYIMKIMCFK